ncbi:MAG TPA: BON domain-containing protein, partial [Actinomycetota bacterium]|nr:BON domain-containing protein [Actinomycetota bacterium]
GAGALVVYLLDPQRGKARRHQLRDRSTAVARQAGRRVARAGRYAGATAVGLSRRLRHSRSGQPYAAPNDQTLAAKVESEVFRRVQVPKGSININVEEGVVVLRGEVGDAKQIAALEKAVNAVDGVRGVDNLLHLPGQPAPNKVEAQRVGFPT